MKSLCLGLICLSLLASCGGSNGGKKGMNANKFRGMSNLETDETVTYVSGCMKTKIDGEVTYTMARFQLTMVNEDSATLTMNQVVFSENCEYALIENQIEGEGNFNPSHNLLQTNIDVISMRPLMDQMTTFLNNDSACGFNDWETMVMKNITHTRCVEGQLNGDIHIDSKNNGSDITLYMCDEDAPVNSKCEKLELSKI